MDMKGMGLVGDQQDPYDYIIAGAGPAGCVLGNRLSADPGVRVLLIEAGPDLAPGAEPAQVLDAGFRSHHNPSYFTPPFPARIVGDGDGRRGRMGNCRSPQVLGGGSSVNGMHAQRGVPDDYDSWRDLGVDGWAWDDVLPTFKALETDLDFGGPDHGSSGPIPVQRVPRSHWSRLSGATEDALIARGVPRCDDLNVEARDCVGPVPLNIRGDARVPTPVAYLGPEVRRRKNLTVLTGTAVTELLTTGGTVVGVRARTPTGLVDFLAGETIVCMGALLSPALLLRSGIGPGEMLRSWAIPVVADRPGVGQSLRNHVHLSLPVHLRRAARQRGPGRAPCAMVARYTSKVKGCPPSDMVLNLWERLPGALAQDPLSRQFAVFMVLLNKSFSMGSVELDPREPFGAPLVDFNLFDDPRDLERMIEGLSLVADLLADPRVKPLVNEAFFPVPNRLSAAHLKGDGLAQMVSAVGALALDGPGVLRRLLVGGQGTTLDSLLANRDAIAGFVAGASQPATHATSTCRMGAPEDRHAVTDSRCRVIGLEGLRVVDGSILPAPVRAGTHLPIIMTAEKVASMIVQDRRVSNANRALAHAR